MGLTTLSKTWGDADPVHPTTAQFTFNGTSAQKAALVDFLTFTRVDAGTDVGSYAYTWTLDPAYKTSGSFDDDDVFIGTPNGVLNITAKDISTAAFTVTLDAASYTYIGTAVEPTITSLIIDGSDIASADYNVTFTNNTGAGTGNMTITGKNNLTGSKADVQAFEIVGGLSLVGKTATYAGDALTYTGLAQTPTNFTIEGLTYGTHFEVKAGSYQNNTAAGENTASVVLKGKGDYAENSEITATFSIAKAAATITPEAASKNFGAVEPTFTATVTGAVNSEELVYTIKRKNFGDVEHEQPGTYTKALYVEYDAENDVNKNYTITTGEKNFAIYKKGMASNGLSYQNIADQVYDATKAASANGITTPYTLKCKYAALNPVQYYTLVEGTDFTVTYTNNTAVGVATVTFKGAGTKFNSGTTKDQTFNITAKPVTITAKVNPATVGYGAEYTPGVDWGDGVTDADKTALAAITYSYKENNAGTEGAAVANPAAVGKYYVYATAAANANYSVTATKGEFEITAGQVIASISATATYGSLPTFTLTHVSGLSTGEAATFNATNNLSKVTIKKDGAVVNNLANVAKDDANLATLAAGVYDLEATASCGDSYTVIVSAGKLTVNPNAAYVFTIADIAAVDYKAAKWEPEVTVTGLTVGTDYTVSYGDDTHDNFNAGTGIVKIAGAGNYAGATGSKTFTINKADLTITADNFTGEKAWTYATVEPTYTANVVGLKGNDALPIGGTLAGINGTLKVKRTSNETVGMHTGALVAGFYDAGDNKIAAPVAMNYNLNFVNGDLQVAKGAVVIKLKEAVTATYGDDPATSINAAIKNIANYEYVSGLSELEAANFASIINVGAATFELTETKPQVGTNYNFAIDGATSTNYGVTINPGTYNVTAADITLYAEDQAIDWSDTDPGNDAADTEVKAATVAIAAGALKYTDALTDVVAEIVIASQNVGTNNISLTAAQNANYNIVVNSDGTNAKYGVLTVKGAPALALSTADTDLADKLTSYNGKAMPVTIDFSARNARTLPAGTARTWTANTWVTLTLPFDISVADLSKALGYAIVNVVDPSKTEVKGNETVIAAKLTMKGGNGKDDVLAANKPFLVKTADAITGIKDFGTQTIVAPASAADLSVNAGGGAKFVGTYAPMTVDKDNNAETVWFMIGGGNASWAYIKSTSSATWNILPFEGFIDMNGSSARNMTFYFEELDGSTTAIKSVSTDNLNGKMNAEGWYNLNGVKMQSAPTQKGVYIKDGKKVVIK